MDHCSFLGDRIFELINFKNTGSANFEEFLIYLNTLIYGTDYDKAFQSFKILDTNNKGKITYSDIEKMINGITSMWNIITNSKIIPHKEYIDEVYAIFDTKKSGQVNFLE